jgi:hypothetical protein
MMKIWERYRQDNRIACKTAGEYFDEDGFPTCTGSIVSDTCSPVFGRMR